MIIIPIVEGNREVLESLDVNVELYLKTSESNGAEYFATFSKFSGALMTNVLTRDSIEYLGTLKETTIKIYHTS